MSDIIDLLEDHDLYTKRTINYELGFKYINITSDYNEIILYKLEKGYVRSESSLYYSILFFGTLNDKIKYNNNVKEKQLNKDLKTNELRMPLNKKENERRLKKNRKMSYISRKKRLRKRNRINIKNKDFKEMLLFLRLIGVNTSRMTKNKIKKHLFYYSYKIISDSLYIYSPEERSEKEISKRSTNILRAGNLPTVKGLTRGQIEYQIDILFKTKKIISLKNKTIQRGLIKNEQINNKKNWNNRI